MGMALTPSEQSINDAFGTDKYVVDAIHRAESGRRTWLLLAVIMLTTVAAFAFVSA
jgi:hypothetical protein